MGRHHVRPRSARGLKMCRTSFNLLQRIDEQHYLMLDAEHQCRVGDEGSIGPQS